VRPARSRATPWSGPGRVRQVVPGYRPAVTSTAGPASASAPDGVQPGQGRQEALQHQPAPLRLVGLAEDAVHYLVTLLLFGVAAVVLYRTGRAMFDTQLPFPENVTTVVNGALFVVIVMEVLRTVVAHFEHTGFQLQPFLIIGIVSATGRSSPSVPDCPWPGTKPPAHCVTPYSNSASTPASSWAWRPPWS